MLLPHRYPKIRKLLLPTLLVAAIAWPTIELTQASNFQLDFNSIYLGNRLSVIENAGHGKLSMLVHGEVRFNDDESDVAFVGKDLKIAEKRDQQQWRIEFSRNDKNQLQQRFWHNEVEQSLNAEGRRWLAGAIPILAREIDAHAEERSLRIIKRGGVDLVLSEIKQIESEHTRGIYLHNLLRNAKLDQASLLKVIATIDAMSSQFQMSRALQTMLAKQDLEAQTQVALLLTVNHIDSDYERSRVLQSLAPVMKSDSKVIEAWQRSMLTLESDFAARLVVDALAYQSFAPSNSQIAAAFRVISQFNSDLELRTAMEGLLPHLSASEPELTAAYLKSSKKIESPFHRRVALTKLVQKQQLNDSEYDRFFDAMTGMSSEKDLKLTLQSIACNMPLEPQLLARYHKLASSLSEINRREVEISLSKVLIARAARA